MRRLMAAGSLAAVAALAAACGGDGGQEHSSAPDTGLDANTAQVCADAERVQNEQAMLLQEEMAALETEELSEQEYEQAALDGMEQALTGWSDGLYEQAELADDPQLAAALTGLADGLAEAAPKLTVETVRTGEIPGVAELDSYGETLTDICYPDGVPQQQPGAR